MKTPLTSKPKRRKPLGKPLVRSDAELERLAAVTPADIEAVKAQIESDAPGMAALLNAQDSADANESQPAQ